MKPNPSLPMWVAHRFFPLLAAYFCLHAALRLAVGPVLNIDFAEQVVAAQTMAWGYGPHPPLYTWLQAGVFAVTGESLTGLLLLHHGLLLLTFWAVFVLIGRATGDNLAAAMVAAVSLFLLPQIGWESLRAHTHTVLAVAVAAVTLLAFATVVEKGRHRDYLAFGVAVGAGILSKYNYLLLLAALLLAAAGIPAARAALANRRALLSVAAAAVVCGPGVVWAASNLDNVFSRAHKFEMPDDGWALGEAVQGLGAAAVSTVAFVALVAAVHLIVFRGPWRGCGSDAICRLLTRTLLFGTAIVAVLVAVSGAGEVKERWLQPVLFLAPGVLAMHLRHNFHPGNLRTFTLIAGAVAGLILAVSPLHIVFASLLDRPPRETYPIHDLAREISRREGYSQGTVLADSDFLGGNIKLAIPGASVLVPEYGELAVAARRPVLIVWEASGGGPPPDLRALFEARYGLGFPDRPATTVQAPFLRGAAGGRHYALSYVIIPAGEKLAGP